MKFPKMLARTKLLGRTFKLFKNTSRRRFGKARLPGRVVVRWFGPVFVLSMPAPVGKVRVAA